MDTYMVLEAGTSRAVNDAGRRREVQEWNRGLRSLGVTPAPPSSESELIARARALAGMRLQDLASMLDIVVPHDLHGNKGWIGETLEHALGASAGSRPVPDFERIGVELKTIPIGHRGRPSESTHVCAISVRDLVGQRWADSTVKSKLARVLWMPVEADPAVALGARRMGTPLLWSPTRTDEQILREDWEEHVELITTGHIDELDARLGTYLQVRPKAADGNMRAPGFDQSGAPAPVASAWLLSARDIHRNDPA